MKEMQCLRCGGKMAHRMREKLQLGQTGWIFGDLPNLIAGALETDIYICGSCGKLEFYLATQPEKTETLPQKTCPKCGYVHDFDWPKCPQCKFDYYGGK